MENNRNQQPVQRRIDGISPRRPAVNNNQPKNSSPLAQQQPAQAQKQPEGQEKKLTKKPKKRRNSLVIFLALIVLVGLSSLAVYAGLQENNQDSESAANSQEQIGTRQDPVDNQQLINQTINEIDQLDDKSDSSGEGLSDEKLGL